MHKELKNSRNNATYSFRKAKNKYFDTFSEKNRNGTTLICKGSQQFIILKSNIKIYPKHYQSKRQKYHESCIHCQCLNNFFIDIGTCLSRSITSSSKLFKIFS